MALALQLKTNKKIKSSKMAQPEKPKKQKLIEDEYIGELVLQFKIEDLNKTSARTAKWKEVTTLFNEKFCQNLERKQISKRWTNYKQQLRGKRYRDKQQVKEKTGGGELPPPEMNE